MMSGIGPKNTKPEMYVRKGLHRRGLRYCIHDKRLPGKPDLFFPKHRAAIFVNGCFWHGHTCPYFKLPATRTEFWADKIAGNQERDRRNQASLDAMGYRSRTIWECDIRRDMKAGGDLLDRIETWIREA